MLCGMQLWVVLVLALSLHLCNASEEQLPHGYRASPKLTGPAKFTHERNDALLNRLDEAIGQINAVYMQALFDGKHNAEMEVHMRTMEIELYDMLSELYKEERLGEYMRYEDEVTRQLIVYNLLKELFGYGSGSGETNPHTA